MVMPSDSVVEPGDEPGGGLTLNGGGGTSLGGKPPVNKKLLYGGAAAIVALGVFLYAKHKSSSSSASSTAAQGTATGIPELIQPASNQDSVISSDFDSLYGQQQNNQSALIAQATQNQAATSTGIANVQSTVNALPTLTQIKGATGTTTAPSSTTAQTNPSGIPALTLPPGASLQGTLIDIVQEPGGGADYVTNAGAVYSVGGAQYYGGVNPGNPAGISSPSPITKAVPWGSGGYELINSQGQTYNFDPTHNYAKK
jgi:hypothetical protein